MAVTYITRIYVTIDKSIEYIMRDKVVLTGEDMMKHLEDEALKKATDYLESTIDYIENNKEILNESGIEIRKTLTSTINCSYDYAKNEFKVVQEQYNKNGAGKVGVGKNDKEILGYHVWQSFEENIPGELSNEIGVKLAKELYGEHQCVVSTHTNTSYTHNHIVFNATSLSGKKYNICTSNTRKLREVSDRLCEEYGLNVLEETKGMKLKWYKDENGNWKYFEPTKRKLEKMKGEYSKKNDYRNYEAYIKSKNYSKNNVEIIRKDIDRFIPYSKNLDELISNLENVGYEIKNENKTGGLLKYMTFRSPSQTNSTRAKANILGEEYTRERIIERIEENINYLNKESQPETVKDSNVGNLDNERRKKYNNKTQLYEWVNRSEIEKYIIKDVKELDDKIDVINEMYYSNITEEKKYYGKYADINRSKDRINQNLQALRFVEEKNISSFEQINNTVRSLYEKKKMIDSEFDNIRDYLKEMNRCIVIIKQYNEIKHNIEVNSNNMEYNMFEKDGEKILLKKYEEILMAKKLINVGQQATYLEKFKKFNTRYNELLNASEKINEVIKNYTKTIKTIDRIDREHERKYRKEIKDYFSIGNNKRNRKER